MAECPCYGWKDRSEIVERTLMSFLMQTGITIVQFVLGFYGFWIVWRVLLPILPARRASDRISPFAGYVTDPIVVPLARTLHVHEWLVSVLLLIALAMASAGLDRLAGAL